MTGHEHHFGQAEPRAGEGRTRLVVVLTAVESNPALEVVDLHLWTIGPGYRAAIVAVEATGNHEPEAIENLLPDDLGIAHLTVEVRRRRDQPPKRKPAS